MALGYFSPLGNLYLNEIYHASGARDIQIDYGPQGTYVFGSPSYYNPTFYPFSDWTTSRQGTIAITVDTRRGRADWRRWLAVARAQGAGVRCAISPRTCATCCLARPGPTTIAPRSWAGSRSGCAGASCPSYCSPPSPSARGVYRGREWLLPGCALMGLLLLAVQREGIMEGRYRKPIEPIFLAALTLSLGAAARAAERREGACARVIAMSCLGHPRRRRLGRRRCMLPAVAVLNFWPPFDQIAYLALVVMGCTALGIFLPDLLWQKVQRRALAATPGRGDWPRVGTKSSASPAASASSHCCTGCFPSTTRATISTATTTRHSRCCCRVGRARRAVPLLGRSAPGAAAGWSVADGPAAARRVAAASMRG